MLKGKMVFRARAEGLPFSEQQALSKPDIERELRGIIDAFVAACAVSNCFVVASWSFKMWSE
jgi:hypothetical protein